MDKLTKVSVGVGVLAPIAVLALLGKSYLSPGEAAFLLVLIAGFLVTVLWKIITG